MRKIEIVKGPDKNDFFNSLSSGSHVEFEIKNCNRPSSLKKITAKVIAIESHSAGAGLFGLRIIEKYEQSCKPNIYRSYIGYYSIKSQGGELDLEGSKACLIPGPYYAFDYYG